MSTPKTDRKRKQPSPGLVRSSLDALNQGISVFDADLNLVFANKKFLDLRDIPPPLGEVGTPFAAQVRHRAERGDYGPGDVEAHVRRHIELARRHEPHRHERELADGTVLEIRGDPLPKGGFISTCTDITERKRAEDKLRLHEEGLIRRNAELDLARGIYEKQGAQMAALAEDLSLARQEAEATSRAKTEFLANVSHELRTPLNAIIGLSEIVKDELLGPVGEPKYRDYADDIHKSGHHLLELINDILDISKVESGRDELNEEIISVPDLVHSALTLTRQRAIDDRIELVIDCPEDLPPLNADNRKMKQILVNLLSNAIKFTEADGKVTLKAWCRPESGYVFQVIDTGIGIALDDIPKALSIFGQIDGEISRKNKGTGLGLPLTKALTELHSGSLDLQSEPGIGTTVTVRLPRERIVSARQADDLRRVS